LRIMDPTTVGSFKHSNFIAANLRIVEADNAIIQPILYDSGREIVELSVIPEYVKAITLRMDIDEY